MLPKGNDYTIMPSIETSRTCHDCGKELYYHEWLELRCTLDDEDTTQAYCQNCFIQRMRKYLLKHGYSVIPQMYTHA